MRGVYEAATDLRPEDQEQIELVLEALPLLADVTHADLLVYVRAGDTAVIVAHVSPHPIPSLYPQSQTGRMVGKGASQDPIFRILHAGKEHQSVSGTLVWGAPTLQEVFQIRSPDGRIIAAVGSHANLLEHERFVRRDSLFRSMVARVRHQGFTGRLKGAGNLGRFTEHDGVLIVDNRGLIRYMSSIAENQYRRVGYTDSLLGEQISEIDTNEYICFRSMERGLCLEQRIQEQDQFWIKRAVPLFPWPQSGRFGRVRVPATQPDGAVVFIQDITEDVRKEQELKIKSAMIQEVHHRVKNNLQTLASLLRMEARRAASAGTRETLRQTGARISSVAVVHEFLSRGDNSEISILDVCNRIAGEMAAGIMNPEKRVRVDLHGETFTLPAQQATSCALAINELLLNAVEHGLNGRTEGNIRIDLRETDASVVIEIADDGVGLPAGFDLETSSSLGLQIVQTLVRDDLHGQLQLINGRGVTAQISFPKELCRDRG
jgi:two-component sensor histidine kinase